MSTCCPSASALALSLGPTNPPRITRAAEPSDFRWRGFAPLLVVTHPDIRTRTRSTVRFRDRFVACTTLPYHAIPIRGRHSQLRCHA
jgi:hypothetical protein